MILFAWDPFARFAAQDLRMTIWPYQPIYDFSSGEFTNAGENFVIRPSIPGLGEHRPFLYWGPTTLLGASHPMNTGGRISWGLGAAVVRASREDLQTRFSGGFFYDRDDSLLLSVIFNGTGGLTTRVNLYPGLIAPGKWSPGFYFGFSEGGTVTLGISLRFIPVGFTFGG
jgi:hypothetical protein